LKNRQPAVEEQRLKSKEAKPSKKRKKVALGRGLDALLPDLPLMDGEGSRYILCNVDLIRPNPYQPRTNFPETELDELRKSIEAQGVLQPLLVRKNDGIFELVAGERRLRAAKLAGLRQVPVVVKEVGDAELLEMSIVENIQREGLNPVEEADAYHRLMEEFQLTQDQAAARVGKSRSAIANILRLRQLPGEIRNSIMNGRMTAGQARPLLGLDNTAQQLSAWKTILAKNLSAREAEQLVQQMKTKKKQRPTPLPGAVELHFRDVEEDLSRLFGTKVAIRRKGKKGRVTIDFYNDEDLDRLLGLLRNN
jgi:ParB family transcriptional regulator, chromosome partitioning protein